MLSGEEISAIIRERFNDYRYNHAVRVAETAERLARREGLDPQRAYLAGLLHDYAKGLSAQELVKLLKLVDWEIDAEEREIGQLLHAPVGAYLVARELGVDDRQILEAIRYHTIGSPDMCRLAEIIYIADYIEPGRDFPGIGQIRKMVEKSLEAGIIAITGRTIIYNIEQDRMIHPNTLLLRNAYLRRTT